MIQRLTKLVEENPDYGHRPVVINARVNELANGQVVEKVEPIVMKRFSQNSSWGVDYDPDWDLEYEEERMFAINVTS